MVESNRQRPVIDLDELERQLRAAAGPRDRAQQPPPPSDDPLAELARIVGQDEPGRSYWNAQPDANARPAARQTEPSFDDLVAHGDERADYRGQSHGRSGQSASDWDAPAEPSDDWALRTSVRDDRYAPQAEPANVHADEGEPVYEPEGQLPPHAGGFEEAARPAPKRRGWLALGAVLSVAVVGIAGAVVMRSPSGAKVAAGAPPLIKADTAPSKVQPDNPGGTEVPNQDSQVYAKGGPEDVKSVKVVGGEEQPVDVAQITRKDVPAPLPPAPAPVTTTSPPVDHAPVAKPAVAVVPGLGEARRVKTVSVRPDGTIIDAPVAAPPAAPEPAPAAPARVASLMPTMEMPAAVGGAPAKPKPATIGTTASTTPAKPKPIDSTAAAVQAGTSPAPAPAAAPKPPKPTQVASVATDDATASAAGGGGFAVQLAAPASEQEAKDTSSRLQKRFSAELGDRKPIIRKADVNGKTIYRVRVSGLGKDEANELCTKLQSAGGQCFVAKN
jgi:hypothetical protein